MAPKHGYVQRLEDVMVYVSAGPVIFGFEAAGDLRVASCAAYWIDRFPVTNAQFCQFLNAGNHKEGGAEWIDLKGAYRRERCRISGRKDLFTVAQGMRIIP